MTRVTCRAVQKGHVAHVEQLILALSWCGTTTKILPNFAQNGQNMTDMHFLGEILEIILE